MSVVDITDRTPNPELVAGLERMLENAKSGELRSALVVLSWSDDAVSNGWFLDARTSKRRMLAEFMICQFDFTTGIAVSEGDGTFARVVLGS